MSRIYEIMKAAERERDESRERLRRERASQGLPDDGLTDAEFSSNTDDDRYAFSNDPRGGGGSGGGNGGNENPPRNGNKGPRKVGGLESMGYGAGITLFLVFVMFFIGCLIGALVDMDKSLTGWAMASIVIGLAAMGFRKIEPVETGVPLWFGERTPGWILTEGWHWVGPFSFIFSFIPEFMGERVQKLDKIDALTQDDVKVGAEGSIIWRVYDPYRFQEISEEAVAVGLDDTYDQVFRRTARKYDLDDVVSGEFPGIFSQEVRDEEKERAGEWGVDIIRIPLPGILPDPEVIAELSKKRREIAQRAAEVVELDHVQNRIKILMGNPYNYTKEQALEIVQTERGKVSKVIEDKKYSADQPLIEGVIEGIKAFKN